MNELLANPELLKNALLLIVLCIIEMAVLLKCVKIITYLSNPAWLFDGNLTITPLVKTKNYKLSWLLTILLMPLIVLFLATLRSPELFFVLLIPVVDGSRIVIIFGLIYMISILLVSAALLERILPPRAYASKRQLWSAFTSYAVIFILLFLYTTTVSL